MPTVCVNCEKLKSQHKPVTRQCPTDACARGDGEGWLDTTYLMKTYEKQKIVFYKIDIPAVIAKSEATTEPAPIAVVEGSQLFDAINTQITSMLTNHPEIEVSEIISLEKPRSITLKFSRAQ